MLKKIINIQKIACIGALILCNACSDFLNIVPEDGLATIETAFENRANAERYLYTCYAYMPRNGNLANDPGILAGDEYWSCEDPLGPQYDDKMFRIARGMQNASAPLGGDQWSRLYQGLRACNIFLENIYDKALDTPGEDKRRWVAEVTFLKAYYHFYLVRMYGPVPIIRENLSINAGVDQVKVSRNPVDECFDYIVELLDEAIANLPPTIVNPADEMGRVTKPIAAALKAKVLVTAASPLYNGNRDQATLANKNGTKLFDSEVKKEKWEKAVVACREAIEICHAANIRLYKDNGTVAVLSDTIKQELTIRNSFTKRWNSELIWGNTQTTIFDIDLIQRMASPNLESVKYPDNWNLFSTLQPPLKIAEMYYTNHGVPINEDKDWQSLDPFALRTGTDAERYYIKKGYTTIQLHFDREPRFYASLGFDGGIWYGQGHYDNDPDDYLWVSCRYGGGQNMRGGGITSEWGPYTGYYYKKCVHFENTQPNTSDYSVNFYPWPILRLADLYLLYAEAINESEGPTGANSANLFEYIDRVREKAGLEGVKTSWDTYTTTKKYENQTGMRQIIHRERLIELSLEGHRFWDLRRWKEAPDEYEKNIMGFKVKEKSPQAFYQPVVVARQSFSIRDYFWPIATDIIEQNPNIVQNIGW